MTDWSFWKDSQVFKHFWCKLEKKENYEQDWEYTAVLLELLKFNLGHSFNVNKIGDHIWSLHDGFLMPLYSMIAQFLISTIDNDKWHLMSTYCVPGMVLRECINFITYYNNHVGSFFKNLSFFPFKRNDENTWHFFSWLHYSNGKRESFHLIP